VVCPHCNKQFEAQLLSGGSDRHQGFKCPHCRLFIAYARAEEQDRVEPQQG
jgi:tRNA(Ile2) C34 agmatinyltransferase TiaS